MAQCQILINVLLSFLLKESMIYIKSRQE